MAPGMVEEEIKGARAVARYVRLSPRKVRAVVDLIRGKMAVEALNILHFSPQTGAKTVLKLINSAIANAQRETHLKKENLYILQAHVNQGPTLKRWRPRAMGRATRIRKRTSHITVVLGEKGG